MISNMSNRENVITVALEKAHVLADSIPPEFRNVPELWAGFATLSINANKKAPKCGGVAICRRLLHSIREELCCANFDAACFVPETAFSVAMLQHFTAAENRALFTRNMNAWLARASHIPVCLAESAGEMPESPETTEALKYCILLCHALLTHVFLPVFAAAESGDVPRLRHLLQAGENPDERAYYYDYTPLMQAAAIGNAEAVQLLLAAGANPNADAAETGESAMSAAAAGNHAEVLRLLLAAGADVRGNNRGRMALEFAARHGSTSCRDILLAATDPIL